MINVYEQQDRNKWRSFLIMAFFVSFIGFLVWFFGRILDFGPGVVGMALIFAGFTSLASYWWGDKFILFISQARPAKRAKDFNFFTVAENLAMVARIPRPKLYVIEDSAPNAFATGRDPQHATVCATVGLLEKLNRSELEGVIGHELSHIKNYDSRLMSLVTILVGTVTLLGDWFLRGSFYRSRDRDENNNSSILFAAGLIFALISPLIAQLIQLALSRQREFLADASSVLITRYPQGLIRALQKISADKEPLEVANKATAHLYIVNPVYSEHSRRSLFANLFNTHPPVAQRIKALKEMA